MRFIIMSYSFLILVSIIAVGYSIVCYQTCPQRRNHRPLILPIFCSCAWFLVAIDGIIAQLSGTHGTLDGIVFIMLVCATLGALIYFIRNYSSKRNYCETEREARPVHQSDR